MARLAKRGNVKPRIYVSANGTRFPPFLLSRHISPPELFSSSSSFASVLSPSLLPLLFPRTRIFREQKPILRGYSRRADNSFARGIILRGLEFFRGSLAGEARARSRDDREIGADSRKRRRRFSAPSREDERLRSERDNCSLLHSVPGIRRFLPRARREGSNRGGREEKERNEEEGRRVGDAVTMIMVIINRLPRFSSETDNSDCTASEIMIMGVGNRAAVAYFSPNSRFHEPPRRLYAVGNKEGRARAPFSRPFRKEGVLTGRGRRDLQG